MRVLVVEDHEDALEALAAYLRFCGFDVESACDAELGLALQRDTPAQAVVTDVDLPDMTGVDLARNLRSTSSAELLILGMSGKPPSPTDSAVFDGFFLKPFDLDALVAILVHHEQRLA